MNEPDPTLNHLVYRGINAQKTPPMSVVIMSTHSDIRAVDAASSVLRYSPYVEVVVVNTGRGTLLSELEHIKDEIILVETANRQFPGGTRNLGIKYATSPIVAFLAADCLATPGWVENRLGAHSSHLSVGSVLRPAPNSKGEINRITWAAYTATHFPRMPEVDDNQSHLFSLSYRREVFNMVGLFDETIRTGEDSLLNTKLKAIETPFLSRDTITLHRYPSSIKDALLDQFSRGRHFSSLNWLVHGHNPIMSFGAALKK